MQFLLPNIKSFLSILLLSMVGTMATISGQEVSFYLSTDRLEVQEGETFILEATLENGQGRDFILPDVKPFQIVQGPSTSTSMSIINGTRSSKMSYRYVVLAPQKGRFTIGPATIKAERKTLSSNKLTIQVTAAKAVKAGANLDTSKESFIAIESSTETAYTGQQIVISYVLYTRQNVNAYQLLNEPEYKGFFSIPMNDIRQQSQKITLNGKEYYTQTLKKVALYPQKLGNYTFGPVNCTLDIPVENGRSSFFFRDVKQIQTVTNKLNIAVNPLPEPAPISFSGGVGNFDMSATVSKNTVVTGEALTIRMIITGDGDAKIVQAPKQPKIKGIEYYEASTVRDDQIVKSDKIALAKEFEYILVHTKDTTYTLEPEFTYFSTTTGAYKTVKAGPFSIRVVQGNANAGNQVQSDPQTTLSPMSFATALYNKNDYFFGSKAYWAICISIIFAGIGFIFYKSSKNKKAALQHLQENSDTSIAYKNLSKARDLMSANDDGLFFEEISLATTGYILKKYKIPNIESSVVSIKRHLEKNEVNENLIALYEEIQQSCEMAKFAGQYTDKANLYEKAASFINGLAV